MRHERSLARDPFRLKGPYIKDVRTEGGGGFENCQILRTNSTDRLREMRTKGGGGLKIPKILRTSFMYGPKLKYGSPLGPFTNDVSRERRREGLTKF